MGKLEPKVNQIQEPHQPKPSFRSKKLFTVLKFIATTILCILINPLLAQEVSNVQVQQNGEELKVTFDLIGTENEYEVRIELAEDAVNFYTLGEMNSHPGKNEFRKELKETVFYAAGVFRVRANKINFISDIDGNKYKTIKIGTQIWMKENLKVGKYRNGDPIPTNLSRTAWENTTSGASAIYYNDAANNTTYGKLYNWYAVSDSRNLCPSGWHVPTDAEWTTLENYLGGSSVAGGKLRSTSSLWNTPNTGATNDSSFSGLPGGFRDGNGNYNYLGNNGYWWSSTETSATHAWTRDLNNGNGNSTRNFSNKRNGFSVRCLRD